MTRVRLLLRPLLSLANGLAAVGGYLLSATGPTAGGIVAAFTGVALLAAGGSALNQVMERDLDGLMERTRLRPLVSGACTVRGAATAGILCLVTGGMILAAAGGMVPALLGYVAILWYLAVYTPLKKRTPAALLLGACCGALSPAVGWTLAGPLVGDLRLVLLSGTIYLWQIPHFWLVQRRHPGDCHRAGIPMLPFLEEPAKGALFRLWVLALVVASLLPAASGLGNGIPAWTSALLPLLLGALAVSNRPAMCAAGLNLFPPVMVLALLRF